MLNNERLAECFYVNCCHVCKNLPSKVSLKRCSACRMISYCSAKHQKQHWPYHKDLCRTIGSLCRNSGLSFLFQDADQNMNREQWCTLRTKYMAVVELLMPRKLYKCEREMFLFPRVCRTCKTFNNGYLIDCKRCFCASYCSNEHLKIDEASHNVVCDELKRCFDLDTMALCDIHYDSIYINIQEKLAPLPSNMDEFITLNVLFKNSNSISSFLIHDYISELLTCQLTLLYCLEKEVVKCENLIVHVVGASTLECSFLSAWESILHWLPQLMKFTIVFIGPEVVERGTLSLCQDCEKTGRKILIKFCRDMYHTYSLSDDYNIPSIIMAYNSGIHENLGSNDTWRQSISFLLRFDGVPFVFTSYTATEAAADLERIRQNAKCNIIIPVSAEKNPFSSRRVHRDWETDPLSTFSSNSYTTIVKRVGKGVK